MKRPLIILVPPFSGNPKRFEPLVKTLKEDPEFSNAFFEIFDYQEPLFSNKKLEDVALELGSLINVKFQSNRDEISHIILAGHSMGTTLVRRAYLNAKGYGVADELKQSWGDHVSHLVLFGAIGRGVDIRKLPFRRRVVLYPLLLIGRILGLGKMRRGILNGAYYVSRLRIDWLNYQSQGIDFPKIFHLLGARDPLVQDIDVIDLEQFPNSFPINIPKKNHFNVIIPTEETKDFFLGAFKGILQANRQAKQKEGADKIFFFLHGIRDSRSCFELVEKKLKAKFPEAKTILPSYGYLSALGFLLPFYRNRFVPWFVDQYAEYLARNPKAEFYIAGHSNGTYIIGEAMKNIPRLAFNHVYLAASVLPPDFDWDDLVEDNKQAKSIRSDMGNSDLPVGFLCRVLNMLGMKSIGPGGIDGFEYGDTHRIFYHRFSGGHGAMLKEDNAESISNFLIDGSYPEIESVNKFPFYYVVFKKFGIIIFLALIILLGWALYEIYFMYPVHGLQIDIVIVIALLIFLDRI